MIQGVKTKVINAGRGYIKLVVSDESINNLYNCSNKDPVVLMTASKFEGTTEWCINDSRLCTFNKPSKYLFESSFQSMDTSYMSDEMKEDLFGSLINAVDNGSYICWNTYNGVFLEGVDKPYDPNVKYSRETYEFSYRKALSIFRTAKQEWSSFNGSCIQEFKLPPHRTLQQNEHYIFSRMLLIPEYKKVFDERHK